MTAIASPTSRFSKELRQAVRGRVWCPADIDFDQARSPWNLAVDQPVAAVVAAIDAADVAALVRHASQIGVGISTQPNGHGASGNTSGTILLRTGALDSVEIDPVAKTARIGAGVSSCALQQAAAEHGLTALPGSSPVVSVAGVVLGGGLSWFSRAFGWVADSVIAFDVIDAEGTPRTVRAETDRDLFWALRGGGGDYAIVTGLELALHDAPSVFGGRVLWDGAHARSVVDAYRKITAHSPRGLTLWLEFLHFPGTEPMVATDATFLGSETEGRALMAEIDRLPRPLSDSRRMMSVAELGSITAEPTTPGAGQPRGELLLRLDDAALSVLVDEPIAPLMTVQIRHLGGAIADPSDSPHGPLHEPYAIYLFGVPADPQVAEKIEAKQQAIVNGMPTSGRKPVTFLNPTERLTDALPSASITRLRQIKAERDPSGVFRSNFSALGEHA